jgi:hypothetical protein
VALSAPEQWPARFAEVAAELSQFNLASLTGHANEASNCSGWRRPFPKGF